MRDSVLSRKQIIGIAAGFGAAVILICIWAFFATHQYLTINYDSSIYKEVALYRGTQSADEKTIAPTEDIAIKKVESGKTYHLSRGNYYLIAKGSGVNPNMQGVLLKDKIERTLDYELSAKRLTELSSSEKDSIDAAINSHNSNIANIYQIASETVTQKGDWAVAALVFRGSATDLNRDTQKVVLQKKDNRWQVACPIGIALNKYDCSNAPQSVLELANTIDIRTQQPLMPGYNLDQRKNLTTYGSHF